MIPSLFYRKSKRTFEDTTPNTSIRGVLPDGLVTVVSVQWFGLAVHPSAVGSLLHQIIAVYEAMQPRQSLHFLPASGTKTSSDTI